MAAATAFTGEDGKKRFRSTWGTRAGNGRAGGPTTYNYKPGDPVPPDAEKFAVTARDGRYKFGEAVVVGKSWGKAVTLTVTGFGR